MNRTPESTAGLTTINRTLLGRAAIGGLLGGTALFLVMAVYNASTGMGFWSLLNACFAAFVFKNAGMGMAGEHNMMQGEQMPGEAMAGAHMSGHSDMMMNAPIVASHLAVGSLLHLAMSAAAGIAFVIVLAVLIRTRIRPVPAWLATPLGYSAAAAIGGTLLYAVMLYAVAPALNPEIVDSTPRVPFFIAHLLFGAVVGTYVRRRATQRRGSDAPAGQLSHSTA